MIENCKLQIFLQRSHEEELILIYSSYPVRIQRKRSKGWRMPINTIYVGRPSKWGNYCFEQGGGAARAVELFEVFATHKAKNDPEWLKPLRGKNLACWCKPGEICHADILLKLANE